MATTPGTLLARVRASAEPRDPSARDILDAALSAFVESGVRRSTMSDIARRASLGVATVYRRFPQKDELVEAVLLRELRRSIERVDEQVRRAHGVTGQVVEGFVAFAVETREHPLLRRLLDCEPDTVLPAFTVDGAPLIALARGYLADNIRRLQREGELARFEAEPVAEIIARLLHSLVLTPEGCIPSGDDEATRAFARDHIVPLLTHPR